MNPDNGEIEEVEEPSGEESDDMDEDGELDLTEFDEPTGPPLTTDPETGTTTTRHKPIIVTKFKRLSPKADPQRKSYNFLLNMILILVLLLLLLICFFVWFKYRHDKDASQVVG